MFMDRLALVVVFRMKLAVWAGDGLRRFIGFETQIADLVFVGLLFVSQSVVAEHQVIVRLQIFGIHGQHRLQDRDRVGILALQKQSASQIVQRNPIAGILRQNFAEMVCSAIVIAIIAQNLGIEEMCARQSPG